MMYLETPFPVGEYPGRGRLLHTTMLCEVPLNGGDGINNVINSEIQGDTGIKVCRHQVVGGLVGHSRDLPNPRLFLGCLDTVFGAERKYTPPFQFLFIE